MKLKEYKISDFLKRIKRPIKLYDDVNYKLVTIKMNHNGVILRENKIGALIKSNMNIVKEGDFILSGIDARNGAFGIVPKELDNAIVTNDFWYFDIDINIIDKHFFLYLTSTNWFDEICKRGSDGTTQRVRLQKDKFFNQKIKLPSINEQKQLLERFKVSNKMQNDFIEESNKQKTLIKQLKQSILSEAIEGKLTGEWRSRNTNIESADQLLQRIERQKQLQINDKKKGKEKKKNLINLNDIPFELPTNWTWSKIPDILNDKTGSLRRGPFGSSLKIDMFEPKSEKTTKIYEQKNAIRKDYSLGNYYISIDKYPNLKSFLAGPGDILISCAGTIGEIYKLPKEAPIGIINQALLKVNLNNDIILDKFFILMFQGQLKTQVNSDAKGSAMKNMGSVKYLQSELIFGLPPFEEQKKIVEEYERIFSKCKILEDEIKKSKKQSNFLMQAVLEEAFEIKNENVNLDLLFNDVNYNLYLAMIHKQIENRLKINYGEVATQKTVFNINAFTDQKIPYNFINSNHGTFSPQLKDDLSKNSYLAKDRKGSGEVFIINPSKQKEVLDALSNPKNKSFVRAVNEVLDIYELPFINKETDKIELLNTVAKLIIDTKSKDLEIIYTGMEKWEIKQNGFKTKAEKFSKSDTKKMIGLIENLGLVNKLLKN